MGGLCNGIDLCGKKKQYLDEVPQSDRDAEEDSTTSSDGGDERGKWSRHLDFILVALGYAVGFGNIWRFPYLCMRNGGGAFLVPYFFLMLTFGIPLHVLEYSIGQYSSQGATTVWKLSPMFKGIGWGMIATSAMGQWYNGTIMAWTLYYLYNSFSSPLPWATCDNAWNTESCYSRVNQCENLTASNGCNGSSGAHGNISQLDNATRMTSAEEFWQFNVLQLSSGIDNPGGIRLELLICLVLARMLVLACMIKGVHSIGKVVYVTATIPYVFLLILLIRGILLPGFADGVLYYITPRWQYLLSIKTWGEAALQIFYSLGPAWGGLITMASYNNFNNNCLRDAILIPTLSCLTSFYGGFVIFGIVGFMAHDIGLPVEEVITSGPGLVFAAYPEALSRLPFAPFWAVCFFLMLITVGLDSHFTTMETIVTGLSDRFPALLRFGKPALVIIVSSLYVLISIPCITRAGVYYFQVADWYLVVFSLPAIAFLECMVLGYVYGATRFYQDLRSMIGYTPSILWKILCFGITPVVSAMIIFFNLYTSTEPSYGDYYYPVGAIAVGWIIAFISFVPVVVIAIVSVCREQGTLLQRLQSAARPASDWGPAACYSRQDDQTGYELETMTTATPDKHQQ